MLQLNLPGRSNLIEAQLFSTNRTNENGYEWIGKTNEGRGYVIVISNQGLMHIQISTPENVYSIVPVGNQIYSLREFDIHEVGDVGCATSSDEKERDEVPNPTFDISKNVLPQSNARLEPCDEQINPRILILYSTTALAYAGGATEINNLIAASIAQFNLAISNSNINNNAKLVLAGTYHLYSFDEGDDGMEVVKNNLIANATANSLRDSYQADLVLYLNTYGSAYPRGVAGYSEVINANSAYAVVQVWAATEYKTFAHEVGHLFGCRHQSDPGTPSYARGYDIKNFLGLTVDRTLMNTNGENNRLINFSNPDVSVSGRATGDSDHDNARRIDETWSTISSFRANPPNPGSAHIEGTTYVTSPGYYTYEVVHKCFLGPYSFQWQFSTDGINYTNTSTTDTYTHYIGHAQTLYLKCQIGSYTTVYATVVAVMAEEPEVVIPPVNILTELPVNSESKAVIYPNPSGGVINISYITSEKAKATLKISDSFGKQVKTLFHNKLHTRPGHYHATWDAVDQKPGIYFYRLEINGKITTGQILLTNKL